MEQPQGVKSTLLIAVVIGIALHGTYSALFSLWDERTIFPIISLVLAVYCLLQRYLHQPMIDGMPKLIFSFFLFGVFGYNAFSRVIHPELGSNFFSSVVLAVLVLWIYKQLKQRQRLRIQE